MRLKIPYFRQEKNTTCGVACVRMIFSFYGKELNEFELEEACETGWLGNICSELVRGVKKIGLEAEEVENVSIEFLQNELRENRPLIALLDPAVLYGGIEGFGHFVVIKGLEDDKIHYNDPDLDKDLTKSISDFMKAWKKFSFKGVRIWKSTKR